MGYLFDADTEVTRRADGAYDAEISDRWHALSGAPLGSYGLTIGLRALAHEMPFPHPLSVSAYFLRPTQVGPAQVRTEVARIGRRMATGQTSLFQSGKERLRAVATYTNLDKADGGTQLLGHLPRSTTPPDTAFDPLDDVPLPGFSLLDRLDFRVTEPPGWLQGKPSGDPACQQWVRFADGRDPDLLSLAFFWDALAPVVLEVGETMSTTLEATIYLRRRPAPGWLTCRARTRYLTGGLHEEDMEIWDSTDKLVAQSRQLALLP